MKKIISVYRMGQAKVINLPKAMLEALNLADEKYLQIELEEDKIVIKKMGGKKNG